MEQKPQPPFQSKPPTILHRECLKNHAAALGGHALDGCCEFMPSPAAAVSDPASLKCAACGCHRNFHRRLSLRSEIEGEGEGDDLRRRSPGAPHALLALSRGERPRKRFRTKFSAEQKGRMMELSERLGWRLQKRDEGLVEDCCREIGVRKGVFKVWMHNNKYHLFGALRRGEGRGDVAGDVGRDEGNGICAEADGNVMNGSSSSS